MNQEIKLYHYISTRMRYVFLSYVRHWAQHFIHMISNPPNNPARHKSRRTEVTFPKLDSTQGWRQGWNSAGWFQSLHSFLICHIVSYFFAYIGILENNQKLQDTSKWNVKNKTKALSYKPKCVTLSKVFPYKAYPEKSVMADTFWKCLQKSLQRPHTKTNPIMSRSQTLT